MLLFNPEHFMSGSEDLDTIHSPLGRMPFLPPGSRLCHSIPYSGSLYSSEGLAGYSLLPASMEFSVGIRLLSQEDLEQLQEQSSPAAVTSLSKPEAAALMTTEIPGCRHRVLSSSQGHCLLHLFPIRTSV